MLNDAAPSAAEDPLPLPEPKPALDSPALAPKERRLQYLRAFQYIVEQKEWPRTLILGGVCLIIPVFGATALLGYQFEVVEALYRRQPVPYPMFEFKRFPFYMKRGVWGFMIALFIQTLMQLPLQFGLQFGIMGLMMLFSSDPRTGAIVAAIIVPLFIVFLLCFVLTLSVCLTPVFLRAGLTQDFAQIFNFSWIRDFIRKMWRDTLLTAVYMYIAAIPLFLLGLLACGIGLYVAAVFFALANAHLTWQLYEIYLERGGEPLTLQPQPGELPPAPVAA